MSTLYNVVFRGKIHPDTDIATIKSKMPSVLGLTPAAVESIFSKPSTQFKRSVPYEQATRFKMGLLSQVGIICDLEPVAPPSTNLGDALNLTPPNSAATTTAKNIKCAVCGFLNSADGIDDTCLSCGTTLTTPKATKQNNSPLDLTLAGIPERPSTEKTEPAEPITPSPVNDAQTATITDKHDDTHSFIAQSSSVRQIVSAKAHYNRLPVLILIFFVVAFVLIFQLLHNFTESLKNRPPIAQKTQEQQNFKFTPNHSQNPADYIKKAIANGSPNSQNSALATAAKLYADKGNYALSQLVLKEINDTLLQIQTLTAITQIYLAHDKTTQADDILANAKIKVLSLSKPIEKIKALLHIAQLQIALEKPDVANGTYSEAEVIARNFDHPIDQITALSEIYAHHINANNDDLAEEAYDSIQDTIDTLQNIEHHIQALAQLGYHQEKLQLTEQSADRFDSALELIDDNKGNISDDQWLKLILTVAVQLAKAEKFGLAAAQLELVTQHPDKEKSLFAILKNATITDKTTSDYLSSFNDQIKSQLLRINANIVLARLQSDAGLVYAPDALFGAATQSAALLTNPAIKSKTLTLIASTRAQTGRLKKSKKMFLEASSVAKGIKGSVKRDTAYHFIAKEQANASFFQDSLKTAELIQDHNKRAQLFKIIATKQNRINTLKQLFRPVVAH